MAPPTGSWRSTTTGGRVHLIARDIWTKAESIRPDLMRVKVTSRLGEVLRRAMVRPTVTRFDPLICIEEDGSVIGMVRLEHLVTALASDVR